MITLSETRWGRLLALAALYSAQGLPFGLFTIAIPSWMATQHYTAADVGSFIAVVSLPWSAKLIVAPLMDRFTFLAMGYRRPWILGAQFGLVLAFLAFGLIPDELIWLSIVGTIANTFAATQDVAVDGMAIDILPESDRAKANGFMFGGQYVGISLGASGGGYALLYLGLPGLGWVSAITMTLVFLVPLLLRERPGERFLPWTAGAATEIARGSSNVLQLVKDAFTVLVMPISILLVLNQLCTRVAGGIFVAHMPIQTVQDMGLADTTYNDLTTLGGILSAIIGVLFAPFIDRLGSHRGHWFTMALYVGFLFAIPHILPHSPAVAIAGYWILGQLLTITAIATMMRFCKSEVAATQFAVYMAFSNLSLSIGSQLYAVVSPSFDNVTVMYLAGGIAACAIPIWYFVITRHFHKEVSTASALESKPV